MNEHAQPWQLSTLMKESRPMFFATLHTSVPASISPATVISPAANTMFVLGARLFIEDLLPDRKLCQDDSPPSTHWRTPPCFPIGSASTSFSSSGPPPATSGSVRLCRSTPRGPGGPRPSRLCPVLDRTVMFVIADVLAATFARCRHSCRRHHTEAAALPTQTDITYRRSQPTSHQERHTFVHGHGSLDVCPIDSRSPSSLFHQLLICTLPDLVSCWTHNFVKRCALFSSRSFLKLLLLPRWSPSTL